MRNVIILQEAAKDIETARDFYDMQEAGVGDYFADSITADIVDLIYLSGIHAQHFGFFRMLASRFRFGVYYRERSEDTLVAAVLDLHRDPKRIREQFRQRPQA